MDDTLLDGLRYKSEGTDLDFKAAQYRFVRGSEADKCELLKDILAIANSWRSSTGYILIGFKDSQPHPAEVVGIVEHLDDANIQQFVHGKVKPKLEFRYEERLYDGKTVGVIAIPKQPRPFYLAHPYGALKSNVVYVRRGSSTDEAEPPEVAKMVTVDAGRGNALVDLFVLNRANEPLPEAQLLRFLHFDSLPDYASRDPSDPFSYSLSSIDNRDYWREVAEYVRLRFSLVELQFDLSNRSDFALSNVKLEVSAVPLDGQSLQLMAGKDLPNRPTSQCIFDASVHSLADVMARRQTSFVIDQSGKVPLCNVRFGALLPGETSRSSDTLAVLPSGPGKLRIRFRVLAGELASPIESERILEVSGPSERLGLAGLKRVLLSEMGSV